MPQIGVPELILVGLICIGPLVLAAVVIIVVVALRGRRVPCPYCGERIRTEATVCRYCGRDVTPAHPTAEPEAGESDREP